MADSPLSALSLNEDRFLEVLRDLVGETEWLQNMPPEHIPQEDRFSHQRQSVFVIFIVPHPLFRAGKHVLNKLEPFKIENGGPLDVQVREWIA